MRRLQLSFLLIFVLGVFPLFGKSIPSSNQINSASTQQEKQLNLYCLSIEKEYFDFIIQGKKTSEGRVNMPDICHLNVGDLVSFRDGDGREIICKVTTVAKYPTFTKMLVSQGVSNMLPNIDPDNNSAPEMVLKGDKIYLGFPGYKENVKIYGAIAFGIQYTGTVYIGSPNITYITDD